MLSAVSAKRRSLKLPVVYPSLPQTVRGFLGFDVDVTSRKRWRAFVNPEKRGEVTFPVQYLLGPLVLDMRRDRTGRVMRRRSLFGSTLIHVILLYCVELIRTRMPAGARNPMLGYIHFEKYLVQTYEWGSGPYSFYAGHINREVLDSYSRWISENCPDNDKYIGYVRDLYAFGVKHDFPGFDGGKLRQLKTVRVRSKFVAAVARFRDPVKGAFDFEEQRQIILALDQERGRAEDRAVAGVFHQTGIRGCAAIRLRYKHLRRIGTNRYILEVPRVKQRVVTNETREYPIEQWLGDLLMSLRPAEGTGNTFLFYWVPSLRLLRDCLARWAREAELFTVRIDEDKSVPLPVAPYRFRRTLASNLAAQGASPWTIARVLDDKSLGMAVVYTNNSSTIVETLERTLDQHPAYYRLMHLFLGRFAEDRHNGLPSILGGVPYLANYERFAQAIGEIGRCALRSVCKLAPPLSCYECSHFRAKLDPKPHEMQLEQLKDDINSSIGHESDGAAGVLVESVAAVLSAIAAVNIELGRASEMASEVDVSGAISRTKTRVSKGES